MKTTYIIKAICAIALLLVFSCIKPNSTKETKKVELPKPEILSNQCDDVIGKPRVERISEHVWAAISYDLANTVLIHTNDGNVIIDTGMSMARARLVKDALAQVAPVAPIKAIIYTHSHIDHIGGTAVWMEEGTRIWATDAFAEHFFKQYGIFRPTETIRGMRQFGYRVPIEDLPCSALGRRADIDATMEGGLRLPTDTFSGEKTLEIGGVKIQMVEAHGETHDQLFVWVPDDKTVVAGDDFYWTFPNLYTIRGTSPRPINDWIASIDAMRRKDAEHMIPMHTKAIHGKKEIAEALTNYRDAIQWVRDGTVRLANQGADMDTIAENVKLPPHLAKLDYLRELYGQVDWSARAIYTNDLGWFDGRPELLYQLPRQETAKREIELMGGAEKVLRTADDAMTANDPKWAINLLIKLKHSGLIAGDQLKPLDQKLAQCYRKLAETVANSNGRAYLLESATEIERGVKLPENPKLDESVAARIPLATIFYIMSTRLDTEKAMDVFESAQLIFTDENKKFTVTVRHGVAEIVEGEPLPGTPEPTVKVTTDGLTYRKLALDLMSPASALSSGKLKIDGGMIKFAKFMGLFKTGV